MGLSDNRVLVNPLVNRIFSINIAIVGAQPIFRHIHRIMFRGEMKKFCFVYLWWFKVFFFTCLKFFKPTFWLLEELLIVKRPWFFMVKKFAGATLSSQISSKFDAWDETGNKKAAKTQSQRLCRVSRPLGTWGFNLLQWWFNGTSIEL